MGAVSSSLATTLAIGDWVVARSEGLLECEYALFAASDVLLASPIAGAGVREQGYLTTASLALERLDALGATPALAHAAFDMLAADARRLLRAPSLARALEQLGPSEAFEGGTYHPDARRYEGTWLDLDVIARASDTDMAFAMQLAHLAAALAEVKKDVPVRLWVDGRDAPAGARSFRRVAVDVGGLPDALRRLTRPLAQARTSDDDLASTLVGELRARAAIAIDPRRLHALASAVTRTRDAAAPGQPDVPDVIITDDLEYEPVPLIDELRSHTEMLHGEGHLREVAQFMTAMIERKEHLAGLALLAARAWLASGEVGYARYFARRVTEDASAGMERRVAAIEILESTTPTNQSMRPPPASLVEPTPIMMIDEPRAAPPGASQPPTAIAAPEVVLTVPAGPPRVEVVETMSSPEGNDARIRMSRLARELARDYRLSYGTTLKTDPVAIEAMQRHLRRRFADADGDARTSKMLETELTRHGALLSEILIRMLGAQWVDVSSAELGRWAMVVPPSTRVWPIGRVYRFFEQGHRESDLVAFYFDLQKGTRG
jgi:hypothetical protein